MNEKIKKFASEFNTIITNSQKFCFISRAKEFQIEAIEKLKILKNQALQLKQEAITHNDADSANATFCYEAMIEAVLNELEMWIALKDDNPNAAWDYLVNAQISAETAMKAHSIAGHLDGYISRLHALEKLLYPVQMFFSSGMIIGKSRCSICGQDYGECEHIKGKVYMGQICAQIVTGVKLEEVSIVQDPSSKKCRAYNFTEGDITRDIMTWRVIPKKIKTESNDEK